MKKTIYITVAVAAFTLIALIVFNKVASKKKTTNQFTEVLSGTFEITVNNTGELIAEKSTEIKGPDIASGRDVRSTNIKITDLIPEGTEVKAGDYVATLDRTEFDNNLKDAYDRIATFKTEIEMLLLDTAMTMNNIRDQISNQIHTVQEAEISLRNSKFETPMTIRSAEINFDQAKRTLEQLKRSYTLREAQTRTNVRNRRMWMGRIERRIKDYEEVLAGFTIIAPSTGMIIYKRDRFGNKRKSGSSINAMDRVVATLPDLSSMISKVFVSEIEINKVKLGQKVSVTVDAFPTKSYSGSVFYVANIGEKLPNSDSKVFEVQIKLDGTDYNLRPSMTTNNKIMIETFENVTFVPNECVHTGSDSIPFVYTRNGFKRAVVLGKSNDKEVIIEKGIEPGTMLYLDVPDKPEKFKYTDQEKIRKGSN
jgi:multidrug efflux pump subunit AcrA (membrane-fusion protein)